MIIDELEYYCDFLFLLTRDPRQRYPFVKTK